MKIVLTGFMATGKTETGKLLAGRLGLAFVDTDRLVERRAGLAVKDIFARRGESVFRRLEKAAVREAGALENVVIATGGGAVMDPENRRHLGRNGIIVSLFASPEEIARRTGNSGRRPLLDGADADAEIRKLLRARLPVYRQAEIQVDTDGKSPAAVAAEIARHLKNRPPAGLDGRGENR